MNEERIEIPNFSNVIPYSVNVDDCRLINDPLEPKICPLCRGEVRPFFINFNDKMLMCTNTECDYPFGIEDLKFCKDNDSISIDTEIESQSIVSPLTSKSSLKSEVCSTRGPGSVKLSPVHDEDSEQFEPRALDISEYLSTTSLKKETLEQDKTKNTKQLIKNPKHVPGPSKLIIKNEIYLKNLLHLEKFSKPKKPLVQQTELKSFCNGTDNTSQVKVEIQRSDSNQPMIKVNLGLNK